MKEADVRLAISHALMWHGWWADKSNQDGRVYFCHRGHSVHVNPDRKGIPDLQPMHPFYPTEMIEVKAISASLKAFSFKSVEPEQFQYMKSWTEQGGASYLGLGRIVPRGDKMTEIKAIAVVPWSQLLDWMKIYQKSIPFDWNEYKAKPKDHNPEHDIVNLIKPAWWLKKDESNEWRFHPAHPLARPPLVEVPYFKVRASGLEK